MTYIVNKKYMSEIMVNRHDVKEREKLFISLYRTTFPVVARYVSKSGGSFDEAKDIFQDALIIYFEKKITASWSSDKSDKAYIVGVARNLWINKYRAQLLETPLEVLDNPKVSTLDEVELASSEKVMTFLATAGKKCMDLLQAFYYLKTPLEEIASAFKFSGIRSATVQKYKCLQKVRDTVREKSLSYEDFVE